jgi:hypothetical protein
MQQNKPCLGRFNPEDYKCIECRDGHVCRLVGARRFQHDQAAKAHQRPVFGRKIAPWHLARRGGH